jgi:NitT/TauT family transport system ATP-binding protein
MSLQIKNLNKCFGPLKVYENFDLEIEKNKITVILGPSGCGKTTLLKMLSGIVDVDSGQIEGIEDNSISYLFQEERLLPWMTLAENIEFVLKSHMDEVAVKERVNQYLSLVKLVGFENYYPHEVSGGMKQRVAIARAFAYPSDILLMDEPFKGLDPKLKQEMTNVFIRLWSEDRRTVVYITHDVDEALMLGNIVYVFSQTPVKIIEKMEIHSPHKERLECDKCVRKEKEQLARELMS